MHSLSGGVCVQVFIETSSPWAVHDMYDGRMSTLCMFYVFVLQSELKTKTKKNVTRVSHLRQEQACALTDVTVAFGP